MSQATASTPPIHSSPARSKNPSSAESRLPRASQSTCPLSRSRTTVAYRCPSCSLNSSAPSRRERAAGGESSRLPSGVGRVYRHASRSRSISLTTWRHNPVARATSVGVSP